MNALINERDRIEREVEDLRKEQSIMAGTAKAEDLAAKTAAIDAEISRLSGPPSETEQKILSRAREIEEERRLAVERAQAERRRLDAQLIEAMETEVDRQDRLARRQLREALQAAEQARLQAARKAEAQWREAIGATMALVNAHKELRAIAVNILAGRRLAGLSLMPLDDKDLMARIGRRACAQLRQLLPTGAYHLGDMQLPAHPAHPADESWRAAEQKPGAGT